MTIQPEHQQWGHYPHIREQLIGLVIDFVEAAIVIPGVKRIALIGSLATEKPDPKDADVLVWVSDDADLAPLARVSRKLLGRAQSLNHGGEVFLSDTNGKYIGRICHWKECAPGIRVRCDALNCGKRKYLHDDLNTVKLSDNLIANPPIDIWPVFTARVPVPNDVASAVSRLPYNSVAKQDSH